MKVRLFAYLQYFMPESEIQPGLMHGKEKPDSSLTPEEILVAKPVSGRRSRLISVTRRNEMSRDLGVETKYVIEGYLEKEGNVKPVSLVEREYDDPLMIIKTWQKFKEAGLPVVSTMRLTEHNTLLVTNLKADGSEFFGKGYRQLKSFREQKSAPLTEMEMRFLEVTGPEGMEKIAQQVLQYVAIATEHNFMLAGDDPFDLLVHPDGRWKILALDLDGVNADEELVAYAYPQDFLVQLNKEHAELFLQDLRDIRYMLLKRKAARV